MDPTNPASGASRRPRLPANLGFLGRLGRFISVHHRWTLLVWVVLLVFAGYQSVHDRHDLSNSFSIPNTDSQNALTLLSNKFPAQNAATATLVFSVPTGETLTTPAHQAAVSAAVAEIAKTPGVAAVGNPFTDNDQSRLTELAAALPAAERAALTALSPNLPVSVSADGRVAYATVTFQKTLPELTVAQPVDTKLAGGEYANAYRALSDSVAKVAPSDLSVAIGGEVADTYNQPVSWWANHADELGLGLGALLLLLAFGSVFGMAIPLATALLGAVTASGFVFLLATVTTVNTFVPQVTLMICIGVGLDYSLLIVTRYRQFIAEDYEPHDAAALALATAGKAALFAGLTVCIALLGLVLVPIPVVQNLGIGAAIGVAVMILAATTLLPALLGFAGNKIDRFRLPFGSTNADPDPATSFWGRFAEAMSQRPWAALIGGVAVLLLLASPFLHVQFGIPDDSSLPNGLSQRKAFVLIDEGFGPGANGPLLVVATLPKGKPPAFTDALKTLAPVSKALGALQPANTIPGVRYSVGPIPNDATKTTAVVYEITPETGPDDPATHKLVTSLRSNLEKATAGTGITTALGGNTATNIDLTAVVVRYLPIVIAAVVLGAFLLLMLVFRSLLVPLKASLLNLLSIAASYGVVVAVFQWGWGKSFVGLSAVVPIVSFVPLIMFVILFGLSMDYEVFLMSRIREEWDRTHDPRTSVVLGVAKTARVITTAALIMIVVFASFVTNASPTIKLIGFGMAIAVLIDSTIVRMVLVPAAMELFGKAAWWFPKWLHWLPHLNIEGPSTDLPADPPLVAAETTPGDNAP